MIHSTLIYFIGFLLSFNIHFVRSVVETSHIQHAVYDASFPGRSSNIVITPLSEEVLTSGFFRLSWDNHLETQQQPMTITEFHRLLTSVLSLPFVSVNSKDVSSSLSSDLLWHGDSVFTRPVANLLFVIEGTKAPPHNITSYRPLRTVGWPYDTINTLTSALTGTTPATHGIVAQEWMTPEGNKQVAYRDEWPLVASIPDILTQYRQGQSLVVAMSSNPTLSLALSPRPALRSAHTHILTWQPHNHAMDTLDGESLLKLTTFELEETLQTRQPFLHYPHLHLVHDPLHHSVTVNIDDDESLSAQFQLTDETILFAFIEIETALRLVDVLKTTSRETLDDPHPDWFAFGFSALRLVEKKYGHTSVHYRILNKLVDYCIKQVIREMNILYASQGPIAYEILYLVNPELDPVVQEKVVSAFQDKLPKTVLETFYPRIYSPPDMTATLCNHLKSLFVDKGNEMSDSSYYIVGCQLSTTAQYAQQSPTGVPTLSPSSPPTPPTNNTSPIDVTLFHIELWSAVFLIVVTIVVIYCFAYMETTQDPLLYRAIAVAHQKKTN